MASYLETADRVYSGDLGIVGSVYVQSGWCPDVEIFLGGSWPRVALDMAASEGALAAGLLLPFPSHVLPSRQDSSPHSLSDLGQRSLADLLECPTPFANTVLENPPEISQVMLIVLIFDGVLNKASKARTIPFCRVVLVCDESIMVLDPLIRPTSSTGQARFL